MAEEEKEELEEKEEEENGASWFKKLAVLVIIVLIAAVVYLFMHIRKMNRELDYLKTLNVFTEERQEEQEVLGIGSEELEAVISEITGATGFVVEDMQVRLDTETDGETTEGYGFGYGTEIGSDDVDKLYEILRALLEEMEFELITEEIEDLELPFVAFISYEKDGVTCNITRMDIEETEASELEIGCYEVAE